MSMDVNNISLGVSYLTFSRISEKMKEHLKEMSVDLRIYMKDEDFDKLNDEQKKSLEGYERVNLDLPKVIKPRMEEMFISAKDFAAEFEKSGKQVVLEPQPKQKQRQKFYVPLKIGRASTKKKGGR